MSTNAIETKRVLVDVDSDPSDDLDPVAVDIMHTVYVATRALREIRAAVDAGVIDPANPPAPLTQEYVDALEDAVRCWQTLTDRDDYEAFLQDVSTLDDELLAEVRGTIVYVGQHFGIEIDLPAPSEEGD
jgi:hypothetical protein